MRNYYADGERLRAMVTVEELVAQIRSHISRMRKETPLNHPARPIIDRMWAAAWADLEGEGPGPGDGTLWSVAHTAAVLITPSDEEGT